MERLVQLCLVNSTPVLPTPCPSKLIPFLVETFWHHEQPSKTNYLSPFVAFSSALFGCWPGSWFRSWLWCWLGCRFLAFKCTRLLVFILVARRNLNDHQEKCKEEVKLCIQELGHGCSFRNLWCGLDQIKVYEHLKRVHFCLDSDEIHSVATPYSDGE